MDATRNGRESTAVVLRLEPPATKPRGILDSIITGLPDPEHIVRIGQTKGRSRSQVWHHGVPTSRTILFWGNVCRSSRSPERQGGKTLIQYGRQISLSIDRRTHVVSLSYLPPHPSTPPEVTL